MELSKMKFAKDPFLEKPKLEVEEKPVGFKFSKRSKDRLEGVHEDLVAVCEQALAHSKVDFGITEGLRTIERQEKLVAQKKSKTMRSRHLTGHAIDIVCYVDGKVSWDMKYYIQAAEAFHKAAEELKVEVKWGCAWLAPLNDYKSAKIAREQYIRERKRQGRKPFQDGPHFELTRRWYPE